MQIVPQAEWEGRDSPNRLSYGVVNITDGIEPAESQWFEGYREGVEPAVDWRGVGNPEPEPHILPEFQDNAPKKRGRPRKAAATKK